MLSPTAQKALQSVWRTLNDVTEAEILIEEATNTDDWGPLQANMAKIADLSANDEDWNRIWFTMLQRLAPRNRTAHGKTWRQLQKTLTVLEYLLLHAPSRLYKDMYRSFGAHVDDLCEYEYIDERGVSHGQGVQERAQRCGSLLHNEQLLAREREAARKQSRERITGFGSDTGPLGFGSDSFKPRSPRSPKYRSDFGSDSPYALRPEDVPPLETPVSPRTSPARETGVPNRVPNGTNSSEDMWDPFSGTGRQLPPVKVRETNSGTKKPQSGPMQPVQMSSSPVQSGERLVPPRYGSGPMQPSSSAFQTSPQPRRLQIRMKSNSTSPPGSGDVASQLASVRLSPPPEDSQLTPRKLAPPPPATSTISFTKQASGSPASSKQVGPASVSPRLGVSMFEMPPASLVSHKSLPATDLFALKPLVPQKSAPIPDLLDM